MSVVNPYLSFGDNCEEAFNFYKSVFGGDFATVMRFKDMKDSGMPTEDSEDEKIMHVALPIGTSMLMGSDTPNSMGTVNVGNNLSIAIAADSKEDADKLFNGLSAGGKVTMPIADVPWNAYFGMFTDKFGVNWMVNYGYEQK